MAAAPNARGAGEYVGEARVRQAVQACLQRGQAHEARGVLRGAVAAGLLTAGLLNDLGTVLMTRLGSSVNQ